MLPAQSENYASSMRRMIFQVVTGIAPRYDGLAFGAARVIAPGGVVRGPKRQLVFGRLWLLIPLALDPFAPGARPLALSGT